MHITQKEAAQILKVAIGTIERLRQTGALTTYQATGSRRVLLLESQVRSLVQEKVSK